MIKSWEAYKNTSEYVGEDLKIWERVMDRHEVLHMFGPESTVTVGALPGMPRNLSTS
jgi:hypothetical protein